MLLCKCLDLEYDLETKDCKPVTARQCISGSIKHDSSLINRLNRGCHGNWAEKKELWGIETHFGNINSNIYLHKSVKM